MSRHRGSKGKQERASDMNKHKETCYGPRVTHTHTKKKKKEVFLRTLLQLIKMLEAVGKKDQRERSTPSRFGKGRFLLHLFKFLYMSASKSYLLCLKGFLVLAFVLMTPIFKVRKPFLCFGACIFRKRQKQTHSKASPIQGHT